MTTCAFPSYNNLSDETGILDHGGHPFKSFCITVTILRKEKKSKNYNKFLLLSLPEILKNPKRKCKILKRAEYQKNVCNWITCSDTLSSTLIFHLLWRIRTDCVSKVGCAFWTCLTLPLNSKIGPEICLLTNKLLLYEAKKVVKP